MVTVAILATGVTTHAADFSAGTINSFKRIGLTFGLKAQDGSVNRFSLNCDFEGVLSGYRSSVGVVGSYIIDFPLVTLRPDENGSEIKVFAGPGLAIGRVYDDKTGKRLMGGLAGEAGIRFSFNTLPIDIDILFSAILGGTLELAYKQNSTFQLYRNGLRNSWMPEIRLEYRF